MESWKTYCTTYWLFCSFVFGCTVPGYPCGLLAVLVGVPFIYFCYYYFFLLLLLLLLFYFYFVGFKRGFYRWVNIFNLSSFSIILFAVDLSFLIFV